MKIKLVLQTLFKLLHPTLLTIGLLGICVNALAKDEDNVSSTQLSSLINTLDKALAHRYVEIERIPNLINATARAEVTLNNGSAEHLSSQQVATVLSDYLQAIDKHIVVSAITTATPSKDILKAPKEPWFTRLERGNFGITEVSIKPGNVGYLRTWGFPEPSPIAMQKLDAAFTLLQGIDALIIDLTDNGGGSPSMVAHLSSYFFNQPTHLNSIFSRSAGTSTGTTQEFWTHTNLKNAAFESLPLYVLISKDTFSAAEEFAYNLQQQKRATIIGSASKGGANPWAWFPLTTQFKVGIPIAKAVNPISTTNWEGVGVLPDCKVSEARRFDSAYALALAHESDDISQYGRLEKHTALANLSLTVNCEK